MNLSPIILFVYNRPEHTQKVVQALLKNELAVASTLYVFQDGLRSNANDEERDRWIATNQYIHSINGFKNIETFVSETNKGCGRSIVSGVTQVLNDHNRVIIVEDDILVSPNYLEYMNQGLNHFEKDERVGSINAYSLQFPFEVPEYYFMYGVNPYGWATWKDRWELYNNDAASLLEKLKAKNSFKNWDFGGTRKMLESCVKSNFEGAWDVKWYTSLFVNEKLGLFPKTSFSRNIGFDEQATHTQQISEDYQKYQFDSNDLNKFEGNISFNQYPVIEDAVLKKNIIHFYHKLSNIPYGREIYRYRYLLLKQESYG
jgi:GR25 family glycosyltransferase involved in LPS biosynthesis